MKLPEGDEPNELFHWDVSPRHVPPADLGREMKDVHIQKYRLKRNHAQPGQSGNGV